ncbi:uncharacterized protein LOC126880337 [Diabrotica virgifera virgifera]|uniref:Uncharacterized protein n=1 Tax=Diabrotica virgifera virgifera TaxID=50390 RepID=A0ABM5JQ82_DIAVI|nr:uncharacterized protein LOC126880337 [Diabrotica virgifera virgifera]
MKKINTVFKIIHFVSICFGTASFISLLSNANCYDHLIPLLIKDLFFNYNFVKVAIYGFLIPHTCVFTFATMFIATYFVMHFKFLMQCLNEDVKQFIEEDTENRRSDINDLQYQNYVRQQITHICIKFVRIKGDVDALNLFIKWRCVSFIFTGALACGGEVICVLITNGNQGTYYMGMAFGSILIFFIGSEIGHQLQIESENLLTNILRFKWYQWNKANCEMFIILLLQIQKPVVIKCFAFPYINRELLLSVFRIVHGYIACFQSMKKN